MSKYTMTLYVSPIKDGEVLDDTLEIEAKGNSVCLLKESINWRLVSKLLESKKESGKYFVEMVITVGDKYYDSDEGEVYIDLSNKKVVFEI